ncbi:uncharacterized protein METZ01_LOCUS204497, partial [marine metagenome]
VNEYIYIIAVLKHHVLIEPRKEKA